MTAELTRLLSLLLPGQDPFPAAGALGIDRAILAEPRFAGPVQAVLAALPDLDTLGERDAVTRLKATEAKMPEAFSTLVVAAYSFYYTHPLVLDAIETETGYKSGAPQPGGYDLAPFDPDMLAIPAARPRQWRDPR
ncbi:MAG: hypothetical protein AAGC92_04345 [Pseudomonadota bacterium]